MITIDDYDLPITVAEKIIKGTRPYNPTPLMKQFAEAITGNKNASDTQDMFELEDIKEIAEYLMVYYNSHFGGD